MHIVCAARSPVWVVLKRQLILGAWVFLHFQFPLDVILKTTFYHRVFRFPKFSQLNIIIPCCSALDWQGSSGEATWRLFMGDVSRVESQPRASYRQPQPSYPTINVSFLKRCWMQGWICLQGKTFYDAVDTFPSTWCMQRAVSHLACNNKSVQS